MRNKITTHFHLKSSTIYLRITVNGERSEISTDRKISPYLIESIINDGYLKGNEYAFKFDASLTPFLEAGGYVGQDARKKKEDELQEVIFQKTKWEGKIVKWQAKTFWYILIIGLIGSVMGVISFFMQLSK
jgi:hypothetical protein